MSISSDSDNRQLNVNAGVIGDHAHVEGGITFNQGVIDPFVKENLDDVRSDEFITPAHSQDIVQRVLSKRFLLLSGKDRMGKAALARHIADMLLQANTDELSVKRIRQGFDLIEVLGDLISEKMQNHIVLGYNININEIHENIDILIRIARQKFNFIIFTSELSNSIPSDLQEFLVEVQVNYPYTSQNIEKLLEQYFQTENVAKTRQAGVVEEIRSAKVNKDSDLITAVETLLATLDKMPIGQQAVPTYSIIAKNIGVVGDGTHIHGGINSRDK